MRRVFYTALETAKLGPAKHLLTDIASLPRCSEASTPSHSEFPLSRTRATG